MAHNFQDEQRYTLALLHNILNKIDFNTLATLGFRESYLKSLVILFKDDISDEEYVERLLNNNDISIISIAILLLKDNVNEKYVKMLEERIKNDRY